MDSSQTDFKRAWRKRDNLVAQVVLMPVGGLLVMVIAAICTRKAQLEPDTAYWLLGPALVLLLISVVVPAIRLVTWQCPRCHAEFMGRTLSVLRDPAKCWSCGLEREKRAL